MGTFNGLSTDPRAKIDGPLIFSSFKNQNLPQCFVGWELGRMYFHGKFKLVWSKPVGLASLKSIIGVYRCEMNWNLDRENHFNRNKIKLQNLTQWTCLGQPKKIKTISLKMTHKNKNTLFTCKQK